MKLTALQVMKMFFHRKDVFAQQVDGGSYIPIRRPIRLSDIQKHIQGEKTLGAYCLDKDNTIKWTCVDLDGTNLLLMRMQAEEIFNNIPLNSLIQAKILEFSGRRGYHVWLIFNKKIPAAFGQKLVKARLTEKGLGYYEVFPKQVELSGKGFGNLVKIPMALHKKSGRYSKIIKIEGEI